MRDEDILFWELDWHGVVEHQKKQAQQKAEGVTADFFEKGSLDELAEELASEFSLEPPEIDSENIEVDKREVDIDIGGDWDRYFSRPGPHLVKGTAIDVRVPFTGDRGMFRVRPSTFHHSPPRGQVRSGVIEFTISGTDLTTESVQAKIDGRLKTIQEFLDFQKQSIGKFPEQLHQFVYQALEHRQSKLKADDDLISGLGYKKKDS